MTSTYDVAVLVGSLHKDGYSSRFASVLSALAPPRISCRIVGIGDLPLYNQDLDDTRARCHPIRETYLYAR